MLLSAPRRDLACAACGWLGYAGLETVTVHAQEDPVSHTSPTSGLC
jgi:hypothetical protein